MNDLKKKISHILKDLGIVDDRKKVKPILVNERTLNCAFACTIEPEDNKLNKKIEIMVKPDHGEKRVLRLLIQIGNDFWQVEENEDKKRYDAKKVMKKEVKDVLKDIKKHFREVA